MSTQRGKMAAQVNNQFGLHIYNAIINHAGSDDNVFFSPLSITSALAMTYMGACGETARQMESVMNFSSLGKDVHQAFRDLNSDLIPATPLQQSSSYQLEFANRLYGQKSYSFVPEFITATRDFYNAQLEAVDFAIKTEETRKAINTWVEEQTAGKICDLLTPGMLSEDSELVLVNALYFKGAWTEPFDGTETKDAPFHTSRSNSVNVPMMSQQACQESFGYYHDKSLKCQILAMNYGDDYYEEAKVSMMVALPDEIDGLSKLESSLNGDVLKSWSSNLGKAECKVTFPKFIFTKSFSLVDHLKQMGMSDLFEGSKADLSGISRGKLVVSEVVHKAFIDVNEEGTEAAAATYCDDSDGLAEGEFNADHPFVFFICDNTSGAVIFMGCVMYPVIE